MSGPVRRGLAALIIVTSWGCATAQPTAPARTLKPFESEEALVAHLSRIAADVQRRREEEERNSMNSPQNLSSHGLTSISHVHALRGWRRTCR
jgi:hypothetical protein